MHFSLHMVLAWLDDLLDPADAQAVGQAIEQDPAALGLVNRIRDVMRRLRLGAPAVSGESALDPNTVAEYLDHTLPAERLPDFERVCLESDSYLAEVAACHQIMTLVLGEPADVRKASRQRMYSLALEEQGREEQIADGPDSDDMIPLDPLRPFPNKPRRKRPRRSWPPGTWRRILSTSLIVATIAAGWYAWDHPALHAVVQNLRAGWERKSDTPTPSYQRVVVPPEPAPIELPADESTEPAPSLADIHAHDTSPKSPLQQPWNVVPPEHAPTPRRIEVHAEPLPREPPSRGGPPVDRGVRQVNYEAEPTPPIEAVPEPFIERPEQEAYPADLGQVLPGDEVLLHMGSSAPEWERLASGTRLVSGDWLLAPPQFRPTIALGDGILVELPPETLVQVEGHRRGPITLRVVFGQVVVRGNRHARELRLEAGDWHSTLVFDDQTVVVAAEVRPYRADGSDPEQVAAQYAIDLYAIRGRGMIHDGNSWTTLEAPGRTVIRKLPGERVDFGADAPAWSASNYRSSVDDQRVANIVSEQLRPGQPVIAELKSVASENRHSEVRHLATRWLGCLGEYGPLVTSLGDPELRTGHREQAVRALREGLTRGTQWAHQVRTACEASGPHGEDIYRLLWGFSSQQLADGAGQALLAGMDHELLAIRVLSFWNLQSVTGLSLYYRPELSAAQRKQPLARWRERLSEGPPPWPESPQGLR